MTEKRFAGDLVRYSDGTSSFRRDENHWRFVGTPIERSDEAPNEMTTEAAREHCIKMLATMRSCRERGTPVWIWDEDFQAMEVLIEATASPINYRTK